MEKNKTLYKTFTELALKVVLTKGMDLSEAKKVVVQKFENHPFEKMIIELIDDKELNVKDVNTLLYDCISVCEDFGPDRDYITLEIVLKRIDDIVPLENGTNDVSQKVLKKFVDFVEVINRRIDAPPLFNMILEGRCILEWVTIFGIYPIIPKHKESKNKPVLLMPPYLGIDLSTTFVRNYLKSVGLATYKWDLGVNTINSKSLSFFYSIN